MDDTKILNEPYVSCQLELGVPFFYSRSHLPGFLRHYYDGRNDGITKEEEIS